MTTSKDEIEEVCQELALMLISKNEKYGNSVFEPLGIFAKGDPLDGLNARIDDKLSRIAFAKDDNEDSELDLIGYLILRRVALKRLGKKVIDAK